MKRNTFFARLLVLVAVFALASNAYAVSDTDTDTRIVEAEVVQVTDARISVIARSGVEHVIAIDDKNTKVVVDGKKVALKDLREGDIVTVELDADFPMKLAKNIQVSNSQVARANR